MDTKKYFKMQNGWFFFKWLIQNFVKDLDLAQYHRKGLFSAMYHAKKIYCTKKFGKILSFFYQFKSKGVSKD